ncbi:MAG: DeoR/GlpR family DNA-binding transcription regulator [Bacteroidota bacterium]
MSQKRRHEVILGEVRLRNKVLLPDLANILDVSVDTIRRDVKKLHELGQLKKIHGGAVSLSYLNRQPADENIYARELKIQIADKAQQLINDDSVILISGGTTNVELARILHPKLYLTVFTPSLPVAIQLSEHPRAEVILIGGKLSKDSQVTIGGSALDLLSEIKVDLCFMGTGYLDAIHGLTTMDWEVAQMKKAMIKASKKVVALSISEKLNSTQRYKICDIATFDTLITELSPQDEALKVYADYNIQIL